MDIVETDDNLDTSSPLTSCGVFTSENDQNMDTSSMFLRRRFFQEYMKASIHQGYLKPKNVT